MQQIFTTVRNKYVIATLAFIIWMLFFDRNDISSQYHYRVQLEELKKEKEFYTKETEQVQKDLEDLTTDPNKIQKFAREKYLMKKENEDVYIIIHEQ